MNDSQGVRGRPPTQQNPAYEPLVPRQSLGADVHYFVEVSARSRCSSPSVLTRTGTLIVTQRRKAR